MIFPLSIPLNPEKASNIFHLHFEPSCTNMLDSWSILLQIVTGCQIDIPHLYIILPAKPLSRRRQNCHSSRSNFAPRAGEPRFLLFLSSKKCILTCGHQWLWARPVCVAGAVFYDLAKQSYCIFAGRRATFCVFGTFWMVFFWPVCGAASFLWGGFGGGGWGWGHDNVLSFRSSLRFMSTRQWCYALGFLGFMLTRQWCYALDFLRCDVNTSSDVTLLTFFVVMLTRHWCDALDFLRCYVNTSVMWRSWLFSLLC